MTQIIGQKRLLGILDKYTINNLPKTLMFLGPSGCGKHTIAKYIAQKFNLVVKELDENTESEDLFDYTFGTVETLFLVDLNKFSEKQQNQFLKFIEEPSKSVYILLMANSEAGVLNTILNRCVKFTFDSYSKEELLSITQVYLPDIALEIFNTPGKLINLTDRAFQGLLNLAQEVIQNVVNYNYGQFLALTTRINYKDLYDKVDYNLFFDAAEFIALQNYKRSNTEEAFKIFKITNQYATLSNKTTLLKEPLVLNYLTALWEAVARN